MKRAVVTGANGFVGKAVCRQLVAQGVEVFAVVRENPGHTEGLEACHIIECDMQRYEFLWELLPKGADVFYHFAWSGSAGPGRGDERLQLDNVRYACDAVRSAAKAGCGRFVFAASIMEYEVRGAMDADRPPALSGIYSTAKLTADYMTRAVAAGMGIPHNSAVISNIYGPGERSPRLVNTTIRKLLDHEPTAFSPCEQMYDFIFIDDAARAFYAIGDKGTPGRTYYIGSDRPRRLKDFIGIIGETVSPGASLGFGALPFDGVSLTYDELDIGALYRDTGHGNLVDFADGIRRTAGWLKEEQEKRHEFFV